MRFLIILFLIVYILFPIKKLIEIFRIISCEEVLLAFLNSATPLANKSLRKSSDFDEKINLVLRKYPDICDFVSIYAPSLSYSDSPEEIYESSAELYSNILMRHNFLIKELKSLLNPITALKTIITFPVTVLHWMNFKPGKFISLMINGIGWISVYLLNMFHDEIKLWISILFQHFIN